VTPRRFNDEALEWLLALLRGASMALFLLFLGACIWLAGWPSERRIALALVLLLLTGATGYAGWWHFGNEEWRARGTPHAGPCGATNGELTCTLKDARHTGKHHDLLCDPAGERMW
jgi:hypothetical protein